MKILSIGDIHGRVNWKELLNRGHFDKVVFQGDYVDSFMFSNVEILANLRDIIAFKESRPDDVTLLIGNHDFQYIYGDLNTYNYICSGFRPEAYWDLYEEFRKHKNYFQMAYQYNNYLFTHAGLSNGWWNRHKDEFKALHEEFIKHEEDPEEASVATLINTAHLLGKADPFWEVGPARGGMRGDYGSTIWADQQETRFGALQGYHHVVGHTPQRGAIQPKTFKIDDNTMITYCDVLEYVTEGFIIETT